MNGDKVIFIKDWDIFPHCIIYTGNTGIIWSIEADGTLWIKMDKVFPNLDEWHNEVQMGHDERVIDEYIKVESAGN